MFALVDTSALLSREVLCPSSPQVWLRTSQSLMRDPQHVFCSPLALGTHQSHPTSSLSGLVNIWRASCLFVVAALILLVWLVLSSQGSTYWQWPVGLVRPQRVFKHIESTRVEWPWQISGSPLPFFTSVWLRTSQRLLRDLQHVFWSPSTLGIHQSHPTSSLCGISEYLASLMFICGSGTHPFGSTHP